MLEKLIKLFTAKGKLVCFRLEAPCFMVAIQVESMQKLSTRNGVMTRNKRNKLGEQVVAARLPSQVTD